MISRLYCKTLYNIQHIQRIHPMFSAHRPCTQTLHNLVSSLVISHNQIIIFFQQLLFILRRVNDCFSIQLVIWYITISTIYLFLLDFLYYLIMLRYDIRKIGLNIDLKIFIAHGIPEIYEMFKNKSRWYFIKDYIVWICISSALLKFLKQVYMCLMSDLWV